MEYTDIIDGLNTLISSLNAQIAALEEQVAQLIAGSQPPDIDSLTSQLAQANALASEMQARAETAEAQLLVVSNKLEALNSGIDAAQDYVASIQ